MHLALSAQGSERLAQVVLAAKLQDDPYDAARLASALQDDVTSTDALLRLNLKGGHRAQPFEQRSTSAVLNVADKTTECKSNRCRGA